MDVFALVRLRQSVLHFVTDATPQWYAEGTFAFSLGNRTLIHDTRRGQTPSIDLPTGKVTPQ
jgi:hypothetical protein